MSITVGAAAQQAVQTQAQAGRSAKQEAQGADARAGHEGGSAAVKVALTPAIRQVAQLVAGPLGEVAVTMAAGAVGALLDTRA